MHRPPTTTAPTARPVLKAGLRRLWRDRTTVQLGLGPRHALALHDVGPAETAFLDLLDGTLALDRVEDAARKVGVDPRVARELVDRLTTRGAIDDAAAPTTSMRELGAAERDRIAPDLAAWSLAVGTPAGGAAVHALRRSARVDVVGAGRVGALAAGLLAHAGVGELRVDDPEPLRAADVPAAWAPSARADPDAPTMRGAAALDVCEQLAPSLRTGRRRARRSALSERPRVTLLAPVDTAGTVDLEVRDSLVRAGIPHVPAYVRETIGVVGPFVLPGRTACLRCVDLARTDRDRAWPSVLAQLSPLPGAGSRRRSATDACDGVLATLVAANAALQVLALLDGAVPSAAGTSIETDLVDGVTRHRAWSQHPSCGCGWD